MHLSPIITLNRTRCRLHEKRLDRCPLESQHDRRTCTICNKFNGFICRSANANIGHLPIFPCILTIRSVVAALHRTVMIRNRTQIINRRMVHFSLDWRKIFAHIEIIQWKIDRRLFFLVGKFGRIIICIESVNESEWNEYVTSFASQILVFNRTRHTS